MPLPIVHSALKTTLQFTFKGGSMIVSTVRIPNLKSIQVQVLLWPLTGVVLGTPKFNSSATPVISHLVWLPPELGFLTLLCSVGFTFIILFHGPWKPSYWEWLIKQLFKVSATLQDRLHADCCSFYCFHEKPYKLYIFGSLIFPENDVLFKKRQKFNAFGKWEGLFTHKGLHRLGFSFTPSRQKENKMIYTATIWPKFSQIGQLAVDLELKTHIQLAKI